MTSKMLLQQEVDDWEKTIGIYDAQADFYNYHTDRAATNAQKYFVPRSTDEEFAKAAAGDPNRLRSYYITDGADKEGNIKVSASDEGARSWLLDPADSYVGEDGLAYYRMPGTDRYEAMLPDRPVEPDVKAPNFTRAEQGKLASPDMAPATAEKEAGRSAIQRAGVGSWSPFAASNRGEGILIRALKGTL